MSKPIDGWLADHRNFSQLLDLFQVQVDRLHAGESIDYDLVLDLLVYLRHFPEHTHHPREDVAFDRMVRHERSLAPIVTRLKQEHRVISEAGRELHELVEGVLNGMVVERARLESSCATFLVYYRHHIAREDEGIIPLADRMLTPEDWKAVSIAVAPALDPLFGGAVDERYRELRQKIEAESRI